MQSPENKENIKEREFLLALGRRVFANLTKEFEDYTALKLDAQRRTLIAQEMHLIEQEYFSGLDKAYFLARESFEKGRVNKARMRYHNPQMDEKLNELSGNLINSAGIFVIGGLMFDEHNAGVKNIFGLERNEGAVIDVLGSATSLSLGAHNPYTLIFDRIEDALKVRDNICIAYHPGVRQAFFLNKIAALYPTPSKVPVAVHSEASGTIAASVSIEAALAFFEKRSQNTDAKILAVDGTWAGGHGIAREATGFGVSSIGTQRTKKAFYADRCLPEPTKENREAFLEILRKKTADGSAAGLYIEPDIIGDSGIALVDPDLLRETLSILKQHELPVIADCVQQIGRTGSYWGENVDNILKGYPYLILMTSKSASNGHPFGYTIIPREIADCVRPVSHVTTNQFNGPLLRSIAVAEIFSDSEFQSWLRVKSAKIEEVAAKYNLPLSERGLRGKFMNRGIYVGSNENVKLAQVALLVEDGILAGALPQSLRYQPMLMDYSSTNELVAEVIFRRVSEVAKGNVSSYVKEIYERMQGLSSGLAR